MKEVSNTSTQLLLSLKIVILNRPPCVLSVSVPSKAPNGLRVTSSEFTSDLLVEWNPLSQQYANGKLLGYTIYYRDYNIVWSTYKSVNTSGPSPTRYTLKGLELAHEYLVAVAAFTSKGVGPWSVHKYAITGIFCNDYFINIYYLRVTPSNNFQSKFNTNVSLQKCTEEYTFFISCVLFFKF